MKLDAHVENNTEIIDERALTKTLAMKWHLNVPERRSLPNGRVRASLLLDAIENIVRADGWYPVGWTLERDYDGGLIEMTPQGSCRVHWKAEASYCRYEIAAVTQYDTARAAAEAVVRRMFGANIDGIPIDWEA